MPTVVKLTLKGDEHDKQRKVVELGRSLLERAVNHPDFRQNVLDAQFPGGTRFRGKDGTSSEKTKVEIVEIILKGRERVDAGQPNDDGEIDIDVILSPKKKPVVGSTVLGKNPVRTAYWFINAAADKQDGVSVARHFMHEWLHVAGFYHYPDNSARGDVPYVVGRVVRDMLTGGTVGLTEFVGAGEDPVVAYMLEESDEEIEVD